MSKSALATVFVNLAIASILLIGSTPRALREQKSGFTRQAEFDAQGNIYVSSNQGFLIKMADSGDCLEAGVADDKQTVGCMVSLKSEEPPQSVELEIYLKGGQRRTIGPGAPIRDWHFWSGGQQIAVYSGPRNDLGTYALYDTASAVLIEKLAEPSDERLLPQWAKSQAEIEDESVPTSAALTQERTKWIAKVLRQIGKIKPGMRRRDLAREFTTEGGLSNRFQRTYVHVECPYIKVNVRFKAISNNHNVIEENADDLIESISQPYLAWGVFD
jgi:hypothetical protein